jgi:hypothetical protein
LVAASDPDQPRAEFDARALPELADSIAAEDVALGPGALSDADRPT